MTLNDLELSILGQGPEKELAALELHALGLSCSDRDIRLRCGVVLKEAGFVDESIAVFISSLTFYPDDDQITYELIQSYRCSNRSSEADRTLADGLKSRTGGHFLIKELVFRTCIDSDITSAQQSALIPELIDRLHFSRLQADDDTAYMSAFVNFAVTSRSRLQRVDGFYETTDLKTPEQVFGLVRQALYDEQPFALTRFGDGEGAFLTDSKESNSEKQLHDRHRRYFLRRWYGDDSLIDDINFDAYRVSLLDKLSMIDIIGLPERSWVEHERKLRNIDTVTNCIRAVAATCRYASHSAATNTSIHIDLEYRGLITRLITEAHNIVLVTSHADLARRLRLATGLRGGREINSILIPPAASDLVHTGYSLKSSDFFSRHSEIKDQIVQLVKPGALVLISAGFLGKGYCLDAKSSGGVALDIGSVSDLWMGFATRPNFKGLERLSLPS